MPDKLQCTFTSVAPYQKVRLLAHGLKNGDGASIRQAADMMADGIREMAGGRSCVLVPVPNHGGRAVYTRTLAEALSLRTGIPTWDILSCRPHIPLYYAKKNDLRPEGIYLKLSLHRQVPEDITPIVIDNVLDTGHTAGAAVRVLGHPHAMLAVLGHTKNHLANRNCQFNQLAINMEKKQATPDNRQNSRTGEQRVSPMKQYEFLKAKHPDALLLLRKGDWYTSLNEDAEKVSRTLGIPTRTPRLKQDGSLIAEFPHQALDQYLPRLIRAGHRVAIADLLPERQLNQTQTDTMKQKTEKKEARTKAEKAEVKTETKRSAEKKEGKEEKAEGQSAAQSAEKKVSRPREPQMVTVNGEKVSHGHAFQSNLDPDKWYFTARLDGQQLRPQLMKPEDAAAYQKREVSVESLMQTYYPTKLQKKITPEAFKADNKLSDGRTIDKMVVYKEHDEQRQDVGKYKLYTQVGEQKMSRTMSREDLNAYFDRVTTPSRLVEKNFGEQLHLASFYNQFRLEEGVREVRVAKNYDGDWAVSAKLDDERTTAKHVLSWHDKQSLFSAKTATKEQLAARYLNSEIREMRTEQVSAKQSFQR